MTVSEDPVRVTPDRGKKKLKIKDDCVCEREGKRKGQRIREEKGKREGGREDGRARG